MNWFDAIFHFTPEALRDGQLTFVGPLSPQVLVLAIPVLALAVWFIYRIVAQRTSVRAWRTVLALRLALVALLLFVLADPALRSMHGRSEVFTAVLVDTSRSMAISDVASPGQSAPISRIDAAKQILLGNGSGPGLIKGLGKDSKLLVYGFDADERRITSVDQLKADGEFTDVFRGVHDMEAELRGMPLASVVLLTDGGRNTGGTTQDAAAILAARGVPLYTVGLGDPNPPKDYEVVSVVAPKRVRRNSEIELQVTVRHAGYTEPFDLTVARADTVLATQKIVPSADTDLETVKVLFTPDQEGTATYHVAIPPAKDEKNVVNNGKDFDLEIRDDRLPVLYVEGSPRMEYRFLRRALYNDPDFRLVGLLRLGNNRFYVQGANDGEAYLQKGFPTTPEQLYQFQAIILGDIESSYFTPQQLTMLQDFVRTRGGGLIMLGGVNSFGLGNYAATPIADMLPTIIQANDGPYSDAVYKAKVAQGIGAHPVMELSLDRDENSVLWSQAPPLIGITPVSGIKPGAQTLLTRESDGKPVLAVQNYGEGRVAAFTSGGSWYWRVSVPSSVEFFEKFWRQLVRWLAVGAKERLTVETDSSIYAPGKPVTLRSTALAKDLQPIDDANITATITDPLGNKEDVTMDWTLSDEGVYEAQYTPQDEGDYRVSVAVQGWSDQKPVESDFRVSRPTLEDADTGLKEDTLKEMATIAHGRYFTFAESSQLPDEITKNVASAKLEGVKPEDKELWDTPLLFLLVFGLMTAEWVVRRRGSLA